MRRIELSCATSGERLDRFIVDRLEGITRSQVQRWIREGTATVNGLQARPGHRLAEGDSILVIIPAEQPPTLQPWSVLLSVVYEDTACAVIDKPPGMVVHPGTGHRERTLVHALLDRYPEMEAMVHVETEDGLRPGIVHRLDKDTSGLIVVARHQAAREHLQRQFRERTVEKAYLALVHGRLASPTGRVDARVGRDARNRKRMAVVRTLGGRDSSASPPGRRAITEYTAQQWLLMPHAKQEFYTLVEARPLTGRTHQIRVHMAHIGHPIVGDTVYGRRRTRLACPRQFLHACRLGFRSPMDDSWINLTTSLPNDLKGVLTVLDVVY